MFSQIMTILNESLSFALDIFMSFVSGSFFGLFISFFVILLVTRLIIVPLVGSSLSSDSVRPTKRTPDDHRGRERSGARKY